MAIMPQHVGAQLVGDGHARAVPDDPPVLQRRYFGGEHGNVAGVLVRGEQTLHHRGLHVAQEAGRIDVQRVEVVGEPDDQRVRVAPAARRAATRQA